MAFDSAGFPNDPPAAPRKRRSVIDGVVARVAIVPLLGLLVWWVWQAANKAFNNLVTLVAMSHLP